LLTAASPNPGLHQEDLTGRGNTEEEPAPVELADGEQGFAERRAPAGESAFLSLQVRRVELERLPG